MRPRGRLRSGPGSLSKWALAEHGEPGPRSSSGLFTSASHDPLLFPRHRYPTIVGCSRARSSTARFLSSERRPRSYSPSRLRIDRARRRVIALGALAWILATSSDPAIEPPQRGGYMRSSAIRDCSRDSSSRRGSSSGPHPKSREVDGCRARWYRSGLLYFFLGVLPRADAALRERLRARAGPRGSPTCAHVPSFVPRATPWRGIPAAPLSLARSAAPGSDRLARGRGGDRFVA